MKAYLLPVKEIDIDLVNTVLLPINFTEAKQICSFACILYSILCYVII